MAFQKPEGTLLLIGGHEEKSLGQTEAQVQLRKADPGRMTILRQLLVTKPYAHHDILIIASASTIPREMEQMYRTAYQSVGFTDVGFLQLNSPEDAHSEEYIKRVHYAHAVFFTGGDQMLLIGELADTPLFEAIKKKYYNDPNFIVAGTSAGAMAAPEITIGRGHVGEAIRKKDIMIVEGLGLIGGVITDTHFVARGRFSRLALAVAMNPECIGIGLGEDAALLIKNGNEALSIGSGMVTIIDPAHMGETNVAWAGDEDQIAIENLRVHLLAGGATYCIRDHTFSLGEAQYNPNHTTEEITKKAKQQTNS